MNNLAGRVARPQDAAYTNPNLHVGQIGAEPVQSTYQIVIEPARGWRSLGLQDLWDGRELLFFLVWRELQGTYRQTALGMSWLFIRPLINAAILTLTFGMVVKVPSDGLPYPLFSLAALLPWSYFSNAVTRSAGSLVQNMHIISKVYFPRMIIPITGAVSGLVDLSASFVIFIIALLIYRLPFRLEMLWVALFAAEALMFALAIGLWLATLSVRYRDVSFAISFLLQAYMYASPVIYPVSLVASMVPEPLLFIYRLNPMTGVIEGFRWALLGNGELPGIPFLLSVGLTMLILITGAYVFRRTERTIVDLL